MRQHHAQSPHILFYYHPDYLGHVEYVTDGAGVPYQYIHYSPWGESQISQTRTPNSTGFSTPYRFNAKELDSESGLFYYGARYYHPVVSKWLGVDPLAYLYPGISTYAYIANNPINAIDPDGRLIIFINGMHTGDGGKKRYWNGLDTRIMNKVGDYHARYYDGSMGGVWNTVFRGILTGNNLIPYNRRRAWRKY